MPNVLRYSSAWACLHDQSTKATMLFYYLTDTHNVADGICRFMNVLLFYYVDKYHIHTETDEDFAKLRENKFCGVTKIYFLFN